jgi:hypothetical protein
MNPLEKEGPNPDGIGARSATITLKATLADWEQQGDYNG